MATFSLILEPTNDTLLKELVPYAAKTEDSLASFFYTSVAFMTIEDYEVT